MSIAAHPEYSWLQDIWRAGRTITGYSGGVTFSEIADHIRESFFATIASAAKTDVPYPGPSQEHMDRLHITCGVIHPHLLPDADENTKVEDKIPMPYTIDRRVPRHSSSDEFDATGQMDQTTIDIKEEAATVAE